MPILYLSQSTTDPCLYSQILPYRLQLPQRASRVSQPRAPGAILPVGDIMHNEKRRYQVCSSAEHACKIRMQVCSSGERLASAQEAAAVVVLRKEVDFWDLSVLGPRRLWLGGSGTRTSSSLSFRHLYPPFSFRWPHAATTHARTLLHELHRAVQGIHRVLSAIM